MTVKCVRIDKDYDKNYLEKNKEYNACKVVIHSWSTTVFLSEFEGEGFSSCYFDNKFQEALDEAIHYFWEHEDEEYYGVFVRDFY